MRRSHSALSSSDDLGVSTMADGYELEGGPKDDASKGSSDGILVRVDFKMKEEHESPK
jgi:hypothetical protein